MSLEKGYVRIILFMLIFAIAISVFKTYKSYDLYNNRKKINYHLAANSLNNHLDDTLFYIDSITNTLAKDIANLGSYTPKNISSILFRYKNIINQNHDLFSWTVFDFVDKNGLVLATSKDGVLKRPKKVLESKRQWITLAPIEPWKGHLSYLDKGIISGKYILPYGYGVTDKKDNFIGTVSMGIDVQKLKSKLIEVLGNTQIKFLVFRKDEIKNDLELIFGNVNKTLIDKEIKGIIRNDGVGYGSDIMFELDGAKFNYVHSVIDSRFIIAIGQDQELLDAEFSSYIYPRVEQNIILILFLFIIYVIIKRKVVNPILNLSNLSKKIAEGNKKVDIPRYDCEEIDCLAKHIGQIKKYIGIEEKKLKAEEQNISKTSFLASVSHEIRSPISVIYSIGEILENKDGYEALDEENKKYFLKEIKNQALESLDFIEDLLDVGQAESGNFALGELVSEDLGELMRKAIKIVRGSAVKRRIYIDVESKLNLPLIECDKRRIKQIFVNILNNSIKYSNEDTKISVKIDKVDGKKSGKKVRITIKDRGFGMTKSDIKKALTKYGTIKNANSDKVDSFGLGLPLVKHLIEQHGGVFRIESQIDDGTKFVIEF